MILMNFMVPLCLIFHFLFTLSLGLKLIRKKNPFYVLSLAVIVF